MKSLEQIKKQKSLPNLKSKEAKFLYELGISEGIADVKHPVLGALLGQFVKMTILLDSSESAKNKVRKILNRIKEEWRAD